MCGIVGYISSSVLTERAAVILNKMASSIEHRGPDSAGIWHNDEIGIGLGHRRLSIIDLSDAGHQPMHSDNSRYIIVFNGEIYNHLNLRDKLSKEGNGQRWKGHSDTETILACIQAWGIKETLIAVTGMFALGIWDNKEQILTLARDRVGEKPLYYSVENKSIVFASELKAIKAYPGRNMTINQSALRLYMKHGYITSPHSIYNNTYKLQPGTYITVSISNFEISKEVYWSGLDTAKHGIHNPFTGSKESCVDQLEQTLTKAVVSQMMSDVPLGAFLSGGVDSTTVVALMQANSTKPINTFSIGFKEDIYNEAIYAKEVADHIGTNHTELYVDSNTCLSVIDQLPKLYDEPFADSSQIPTYLVSELARKHVTVSLSGDGGDELFAGYNRYTLTHQFWNKLQLLPLPLRRIAQKIIRRYSPEKWNKLANFLKFTKWTNFGEKLHKSSNVLLSKSTTDLYENLITLWHNDNVLMNSQPDVSMIKSLLPELDGISSIEQMMIIDLLTYLPDDILCKVDRAGMGVSLETRMPFLDKKVIELAWRLPMAYKIRGNSSKWALREVLYRHVPKEMINRPKMGFGVPIDSWLRTSLRDWCESLLNEKRIKNDGHLNAKLIAVMWKEHLSGERNWHHQLWAVLMFNQWLDHNS